MEFVLRKRADQHLRLESTGYLRSTGASIRPRTRATAPTLDLPSQQPKALLVEPG